MPLVKTERGKEALQRREPSLSPRERQIIVLANGKLTQAALGKLMQHDIQSEVERLIKCGYLALEAASSEIGTSTTMQPVNAELEVAVLITKPKGFASDPPAQVQQQPSSRRSLAGTKMYIMDMLQFMRTMDASSMAVAVHTSHNETEFVQNVVAAVRLIAHTSGSSYGLRVVGKLREMVPQAHLLAIEALAVELETGVVES